MDLSAFPPVRGHLDTATVGVPPLAAAAATRRAVDAWAFGTADARGYDADVERARVAFAAIAGCAPEDVAQGASASMFVGLVAAALPAGARVLVAEGDFTSVLFPLLAQADRGVEVRAVALADLLDAVDARTDLVAVSAVQSADGCVLDLAALAAAADHHGTRVLLDATQAAGWLPLGAGRFDYVVAAAYKWLLSPRGTAFMAIRPDAAAGLRPSLANWYAGADPWTAIYGTPLRLAESARRFDLSPAWSCWPGAAVALEWIAATGVDALHAHALQLAGRLRDGLGLPASDSAIVSLQQPGAEAALARAGVRCAGRAGRIRLACHVPATAADVDLALTALT